MNSVIIKHTSEFEQTKLGELLDGSMLKCLKDSVHLNQNMGTELATLLEIDNLPREVVMILSKPWYHANMLANWIKENDLSSAKERANNIVKTIAELKNLLNANSLVSGVILMLLDTSTELDLNRFLFYLDEVQNFFESFINIDFRNSQTYSVHFLTRYAINSLFWMGNKMGLTKIGKPTQLNHYLHIVTDRLYADINKDYLKYNNIDFINVFEKNRSVLLLFIFNPCCNLTNNVLTKIRNRFMQT